MAWVKKLVIVYNL